MTVSSDWVPYGTYLPINFLDFSFTGCRNLEGTDESQPTIYYLFIFRIGWATMINMELKTRIAEPKLQLFTKICLKPGLKQLATVLLVTTIHLKLPVVHQKAANRWCGFMWSHFPHTLRITANGIDCVAPMPNQFVKVIFPRKNTKHWLI